VVAAPEAYWSEYVTELPTWPLSQEFPSSTSVPLLASPAGTLGLILGSEGRYGEGKPLMQEMVRICIRNGAPSDTITTTLAAPRRAVATAMRPWTPPSDHPEQDDDLKSLRADPRFIAMVEDLQKRAHAPAAGQ
jgi:hypothetical protein